MRTHTRWLCDCVCLCVEYLFDLCHGPRLIMSADRSFFTLKQHFALFGFLGDFFFQPVVVVNLSLIQYSCLYLLMFVYLWFNTYRTFLNC